MTVDFYCFNIGTSHNRNEPTNLLVRLHVQCAALEWSRISKRKKNKLISPKEYIDNTRGVTAYKYINDGVGSKEIGGKDGVYLGGGVTSRGSLMGAGLSQKARDTLEDIKAINPLPDRFFLAGHSRGAILCIEIADLMRQDPDLRDKEVYMFLLDPCKFSVQTSFTGSSGRAFGDTLYPNATQVRVVAAEDLSDGPMHGGNFKLCTLYLSTHGSNRNEVTNPGNNQAFAHMEYLRIPGSHGTGSQVDGHPIGDLTYELAYGFFAENGATVLAPYPWRVRENGLNWDEDAHELRLIERYARTKLVNPWIEGKGRLINDSGVFRFDANKSRKDRLNTMGVTNRFFKHPLFATEHHHALFEKHFPKYSQILSQNEQAIQKHAVVLNGTSPLFKFTCVKLHGMSGHELGEELASMQARCPSMHKLLSLYVSSQDEDEGLGSDPWELRRFERRYTRFKAQTALPSSYAFWSSWDDLPQELPQELRRRPDWED